MTTTTTAPATPALWQVDPAHTEVEFSVRHLMISNVKGRFGRMEGTVAFDPESGTPPMVNVTVDVASVDTRQEQRDAHLRSADFFDVEHHPTMTFAARRVQGDPLSHFQLVGDLTIRGVTREVVLDVELEGRGRDPWGNERLGYTATGKVNRKDFGLVWNQVLETGGVTVGDTVKIAINTELMRPAA